MSVPLPEPHDDRWDTPPTAHIVRRGRWLWSVEVRARGGFICYRREDGGPYALTRRRAERKARRLLASYLRTVQRPEEHEVAPE